MKLPTKTEILFACVFISLGLYRLLYSPGEFNSGWYTLLFGITVFLFPVPQLRERFKWTEQTSEQWRKSVKKASAKGLSWWSSPLPWGVVIVLLVIFANFR